MMLALGDLSTGELAIGCEFCCRLNPGRFHVKVVVPDSLAEYVVGRGLECFSLLADPDQRDTARRLLTETIESFQPNCFLVADPFTLEFAARWSGLTFADLKQFHIPVIGIDEYQYTKTGYKVDFYGGQWKLAPPHLDDCDYVVRNCPLNVPDEGPRLRSFSLYSGSLRFAEERRVAAKDRLGCRPEERVVFIANSRWEDLRPAHSSTALAKWLPEMISRHLEAVRVPLMVIHVGPTPWRLGRRSRLRYRHVGFLPPKQFDELLLSSDLFITTNLVAVTLSKAVFGQVPSLVLQNDRLVDLASVSPEVRKSWPLWYRRMAADLKLAFPFRLFPFGWYNFLEPIMADNPYTEAFAVENLFDTDRVTARLSGLLEDEAEAGNLRRRQGEYVAGLSLLPDPDRILDEFLGRACGGSQANWRGSTDA